MLTGQFDRFKKKKVRKWFKNEVFIFFRYFWVFQQVEGRTLFNAPINRIHYPNGLRTVCRLITLIQSYWIHEDTSQILHIEKLLWLSENFKSWISRKDYSDCLQVFTNSTALLRVFYSPEPGNSFLTVNICENCVINFEFSWTFLYKLVHLLQCGFVDKFSGSPKTKTA